MRVLLATYKGSFTVEQVADHLRTGMERSAVDATLDRCPTADGGKARVAAVVTAGFRRRTVVAEGPTEGPGCAEHAKVDGRQRCAPRSTTGASACTRSVGGTGVGVVELAQAKGLSLLPVGVKAPLCASTRGAGQLTQAALDRGCRTVVIRLGGSASTDSRGGMLEALGVRFQKRGRDPYRSVARSCWPTSNDLTSQVCTPQVPAVGFLVACDVENPLAPRPDRSCVGLRAAERCPPGRGRGARPVVAALGGGAPERHGRGHGSAPGARAAGGAAFAALSVVEAQQRSGGGMILDLIGFPGRARLRTGPVVIREGSLDGQTLHGKARCGWPRRAIAAAVPAVAVGRNMLTQTQLVVAGFAGAHSLLDTEPDIEHCHPRARIGSTWCRPTRAPGSDRCAVNRVATRGRESEL